MSNEDIILQCSKFEEQLRVVNAQIRRELNQILKIAYNPKS